MSRELLYTLRGTPEECDACGFRPPTPDVLEPEEGGLWICWHCMWRWETTAIHNVLASIFAPAVKEEG